MSQQTITADGRSATPHTLISDEEAVPASGTVVVSLARWEKEGAELGSRKYPVGVCIENAMDVRTLSSSALHRPLLLLCFPDFPDGRAYSQARLLRDQCGYQGDVRATGAAVVQDQLHGMLRCGISSFSLRADQSADAASESLKGFSAAYQPSESGQPAPTKRVRARRISTTG